MDLGGLRVLLEVSPVCTECLAWRFGIREQQVHEALAQLSTLLGFRTESGRCGRCLREKVVHAIA